MKKLSLYRKGKLEWGNTITVFSYTKVTAETEETNCSPGPTWTGKTAMRLNCK